MSTSIGSTFPGEIQPLILALQAGVTTITPAHAVELIEEWQTKLSGTGSPELSGVASELGNLKTALTASPLDNEAVKTSLATLSSQVGALGAGGAGGGKLTELSAALSQSAAVL